MRAARAQGEVPPLWALRPEAPAGQASPQEAGPYILRAHAGHTRPCTRTSMAHAVCISPHGSASC